MATLQVPDQIPSPQEDCEQIQNAFKQGWGTDEAKVISILTHRNARQRGFIRQTYAEKYGEDLLKELEKETSGEFLKALQLWILHPAERDAWLANEAAKKGESSAAHYVFLEIACTRTSKQLLDAKEDYHARFKRSLEEDAASHTSGPFRMLLVPLLMAYRYEGAEVDMKLAAEEANLLRKKISSKEYCDADLIRILSTRSKPQLHATFNQYRELFGIGINDDLKKDGKDEYLKLLRATTKCLTCPVKYFEKAIRLAIAGIGTDEEALTRIVVTRAEVDMKTIKEEYCKTRNGVPLENDLKGDISGDYLKTLLPLIGHDDS